YAAPLSAPQSVQKEHYYADVFATACVLLLLPIVDGESLLQSWTVSSELRQDSADVNQHLQMAMRDHRLTNDLDKSVLQMMRSLCMPVDMTADARPWQCPLYRALVVRCLSRDGGIKRPSEVTGIVAALKHTIRVVVYTELRRHDGQHMHQNELDPLSLFDQWVSEGAVATPFAMIANVGHLATAHAHREVLLPRLDWSDDERGVVYVDSVRVALVDIQK
ncbi:hypothetical protein RI367_008850, partial [Sorochytrium milnesiophthora]